MHKQAIIKKGKCSNKIFFKVHNNNGHKQWKVQASAGNKNGQEAELNSIAFPTGYT